MCAPFYRCGNRFGGLPWPGGGRAGFGPLVLLALKFVHSTTLPLVQFNICQPQRSTLSPRVPPFHGGAHSLISLPSSPSPCDRLHARARAHIHTPHKFTLLWTSQPQTQTTPQQGHHGAGSPLPPPSPGHSKHYFQTGALPVPGKQWNN